MWQLYVYENEDRRNISLECSTYMYTAAKLHFLNSVETHVCFQNISPDPIDQFSGLRNMRLCSKTL